MNPELAINASKVTLGQLEEQLKYQAEFLRCKKMGLPLPQQPISCRDVFDLQQGISAGKGAYWGSSEERTAARTNVFSMCSQFGPPNIMFTITPDSTNSFRLLEYCGKDTSGYSSILNGSFPTKSIRKQIIGQNPYAAAKYFDILMNIIIEYLFGWDRENGCAKDKPGVFGHIKAFFGSTESQKSMNLHCHFLLWVEGMPTSLKQFKALCEDLSSDFKTRLLAYVDSRISNSLPMKMSYKCFACLDGNLIQQEMTKSAFSRPVDRTKAPICAGLL